MKLVASSPAPTSAASTSSGAIGNSPRPTWSVNATSVAAPTHGEHAEHAQVGPQRQRAGAHGDPAAAHSSASLGRRTSQMNAGAPIAAVTMPTSSSAGRAITRPATSLASSSSAPSTMLYGTIQR